MKCRYKYCILGGEVAKEDAIKQGSAYYHPQCLREQNNKAEIRKILFEINPTGIASVINSVIFDITHRKNVSSELTLFVLKNRDFEIYNAKGLYLLINSKKLLDKFAKLQNSKVKVDVENVEVKENTSIKHKIRKGRSWGDYLFPQSKNH